MTDEHIDDGLWVDDPELVEEDASGELGAALDDEPGRRGPATPPRRDRSGHRRGSDPDDDDHDHPGKLPRWAVVLGVVVVAMGLVAGSVMWWYDRQLDPPGPPGDEIAVQIPRGASTSGIGSILERNGVIPNSMVFNFYASRKDAGPFEAGAYVFQENSSVDLALEVLAAGPTGQSIDAEVVKLTVPEGLTVAEIVARTHEKIPRLSVDALEAVLDDGTVTSTLQPSGSTSMEGLLFPATYDVRPDAAAEDVLGMLADEMEIRVQSYDPSTAVAELNERYGLDLTTYDVLIVASMVQAEAAGADEAATVASVIYNRLTDATGQFPFLGIDAVDEYGAELEGMTANQYRETDGPYNTRNSRKGLPPTPIGAPGDYALDAAFNPADTHFLYYVLTDVGEHSFSATLEEHNRNVAVCRQKQLCG
ncbi:MAG: endolytic transglycosylase MltG [Actinobacteria bacterium]|nr:endolytic transglycosylase MltG [Actinomycetota bacterium]